MLKRYFSLLLALVMCLSLAACGGGTENGNSPSDDSVQKTDESKTTENIPQTENTVPLAAFEPERPETDELTWNFDSKSGTLFIHGEGMMRSYAAEPPEWDVHKDQIHKIVLDDTITSVGEYAFYDYPQLEEVNLPDSVEIIDTSAFDYARELKTITIPASLKYVGSRAFYNTLLWNPKDLVFPEGCEYIGDFAFHSALKSGGMVSLPSTLKYLGDCSFTNSYLSDFVVSAENENYCSEDHVIYTKDKKEMLMMAPVTEREDVFCIPDGVEKIGAECFNAIQNIKTIQIPASVKEISEEAFFSTFDLEEILVDEGNQFYQSQDGLLLTKDGKLLLGWPDGRKSEELVIPEGVERLSAYLFYGRTDRGYKVVLPEGVKELGTFSLPYNVTSITLPLSLEKIDSYVFYSGMTVGSISYDGTKEDWEKVSIEDGNELLESLDVRMKS